jgi:hypothetical protein
MKNQGYALTAPSRASYPQPRSSTGFRPIEAETEGRTGEVLDARSRDLHRRRIRALREQADEARAHNDALRASSAEHEVEVLLDELASGWGPGGG